MKISNSVLTKPTKPLPIFRRRIPKKIITIMGSYIAGSITTAILMDYLENIALSNRMYHDEIGVYRR